MSIVDQLVVILLIFAWGTFIVAAGLDPWRPAKRYARTRDYLWHLARHFVILIGGTAYFVLCFLLFFTLFESPALFFSILAIVLLAIFAIVVIIHIAEFLYNWAVKCAVWLRDEFLLNACNVRITLHNVRHRCRIRTHRDQWSAHQIHFPGGVCPHCGAPERHIPVRVSGGLRPKVVWMPAHCLCGRQ